MRWGNVDYKQLQKLRDNLQKLQDMDLDKFCEDVSKELAARLLALVIPRTPVGQYPRSSGKKGGTLRRGWTARTEQEAAGGGKVDPAAYANALPVFKRGLVGSDHHLSVAMLYDGDFNPRSPCGERLLRYQCIFQFFGFQSTLPLWGATCGCFCSSSA